MADAEPLCLGTLNIDQRDWSSFYYDFHAFAWNFFELGLDVPLGGFANL